MGEGFQEGYHALITGASSGIGEAAARIFAARGAQVSLISERRADLETVAESIRLAGGRATAWTIDLSDPQQVKDVIARIERQSGPLDLLVNNAGVGLCAPIAGTRPEDLRFLFEVNFFALASLCRQAVVRMATRRRGHIINVSSAAGVLGSPAISAYAASKGAVHAYTQSLRVEASAAGIHVTEVLPISVRTAFFQNVRGRHYGPSGLTLSAEQVAHSIARAAIARRPPAEMLPFRPIRMAFFLNALLPDLMARMSARAYARGREREEGDMPSQGNAETPSRRFSPGKETHRHG